MSGDDEARVEIARWQVFDIGPENVVCEMIVTAPRSSEAAARRALRELGMGQHEVGAPDGR